MNSELKNNIFELKNSVSPIETTIFFIDLLIKYLFHMLVEEFALHAINSNPIWIYLAQKLKVLS